MPSEKGLSFVLQEDAPMVQVSDLPDHVLQPFLFLKEDEEPVNFLIPSSDDRFTKNWMAHILTAREEKWSRPEKHFDFYLNTLNFGGGVIGLEHASYYYFDKPAKALTLQESETLAGLYKTFGAL